MMQPDTLLAIDLHNQCGVALFDQSGRLLAFDRLNGVDGQGLRSAASEVLGASDSVHWLVSAGEPARQAVWERAAMRTGVRVQRVGQSDWQQALIGDQLAAAEAQQATLALAQDAIAAAGLAAPRLSLAEARAICVGLWAAKQLAAVASAHRPVDAAPLRSATRRAKGAARKAALPAVRQVA